MPLWTSAKLPSEDTCGWALASVTPPCVAQRVWLIPVLAENFIPPDLLGEGSDPPLLFADAHHAVFEQGDSGGIIAAVFELQEPLQKDGNGVFVPDIPVIPHIRLCYNEHFFEI